MIAMGGFDIAGMTPIEAALLIVAVLLAGPLFWAVLRLADAVAVELSVIVVGGGWADDAPASPHDDAAGDDLPVFHVGLDEAETIGATSGKIGKIAGGVQA